MRLDVVVHRLRALHLADDRRPGIQGKQIAGEEDHQLVPPEDVALLVDRADAVRVAIERNAEVRTRGPDLLLQVAQVLGHGRIGVVVGKGAVQLAEQLDHLVT